MVERIFLINTKKLTLFTYLFQKTPQRSVGNIFSVQLHFKFKFIVFSGFKFVYNHNYKSGFQLH